MRPARIASRWVKLNPWTYAERRQVSRAEWLRQAERMEEIAETTDER